MDKAWKQVLAAVILGVCLPRTVMSLAGFWLPREEEPESSQSTQQTAVQTFPTQPSSIPVPVYIPVLTDKTSIRVLELENYVLGVVLAEMPAYFEEEALKAQAVVARTYALRRIAQGDRHPDGAVCASSGCCQAYISPEEYLEKRGSQADVNRIRQAVLETAGEIVCYAGSVAETTYFSCSGGKTEDALEVWGEGYPYLQSVSSPGEEEAFTYRVTKTLSANAFAQKLGRDLSGDPAEWLGKATYTRGGGIKTMDISGKTYTGAKLRQLLGLNSTSFTVTAKGDTIIIETAGKGHRVGMSQYGADAMAATGKKYLEILSYYYPGTEIDKVGTIG